MFLFRCIQSTARCNSPTILNRRQCSETRVSHAPVASRVSTNCSCHEDGPDEQPATLLSRMAGPPFLMALSQQSVTAMPDASPRSP